ncbi:Mu transposase C-terminal domain-containing protein [Clostridium pasteurianum]|uniref:Mu transposase C-terminal domain-containing protein n=1 Tax=Clostridium pasteurianum TaxID=1501 RepID=UPI002260D492|nr:Mu transposase C-terminal domain-containing protein [Clostridium pasteurianum]UZW13621.1 Mu transposase C-terminal domain-containing protein [Clostridium pasteurianum]
MSNVENIRFIDSKTELDYLFLYKVLRTVKNDSTVSIGTKIFEVPLKYVGDKINIRYDPSSIDKAYIFSQDGKLEDTIFLLKKLIIQKSEELTILILLIFLPLKLTNRRLILCIKLFMA